MAKSKEVSTTDKLGQKFSHFVVSNKMIIIIVVAAIIVALIALGIGLKVSDKQANSRQIAIDALQERYNEWTSSDGGDASELKNDLAALSKKRGKGYPAVKLSISRAIAYEEAYAEATALFLNVTEGIKGVQPLALFNAGVVVSNWAITSKLLSITNGFTTTTAGTLLNRHVPSLAWLGFEANGDIELASYV